MAQVPAQKSVLLFDTCESGSLTEEAVTRGLEAQAAIDRLARAVGRTTVTASTDTAPALEGYRGHGLFTYTLLEAFAVADHDGDEQLEVNELIGYVTSGCRRCRRRCSATARCRSTRVRAAFSPLVGPWSSFRRRVG